MSEVLSNFTCLIGTLAYSEQKYIPVGINCVLIYTGSTL